MPLLEINQIRHISASVRLDESTVAQVDQSAAFLRASADDVVDKALTYVFSKARDFQEFLKTPQAKQAASALRVRKPLVLVTVLRSNCQPSLHPVWRPRVLRG